MIKLDVSNFRIIKNAQVYDDTPLSVIMGYNEDGKTSLVQALKFVLVGEAYGHRGKNVTALIAHGENKMSVRLTLGQLAVQRTQASGDTLVSVANRLSLPVDVLPVLFDAKMAGDGGNKALKAFLDNVASTRFNPLTHFAEDPKIFPAVEAAFKSGKSTTKHIIDYCESMRAMSRSPTAPTQPLQQRPTDVEIDSARALIRTIQAQRDEGTTKLGEASRLAQDINAIVHHRAAMAAWEIAKAAASVGDPLAAERAALEKIAAINVSTLANVAAILGAIGGYKEAYRAVRDGHDATLEAVRHASQTLTAHPLPPSLGPAPVLGADAAKTLASLGGAPENSLLHTLSTNLAGVCQSGQAAVASATSQLNAAQAALEGLQRAKGAWDAFAASTAAYEGDKAKAEAEWARWDTAAKAITFASGEHTAKTGDSFGKLVAEMSEGLLQGRAVKIDPDHGIFLGPEPIAELSESTRWRTEIAVMAAVARSCKSPLLLIDGADILDAKNRAELFDWLGVHITPHFQHTILTATTRGKIEEETPIGTGKACKYTISKGVITKLG